MRKIKKNTQLTLINLKGAGRPAIHDPGIRHTKRPRIRRLTSLHLTIKVKKNKADMKNKSVLKILKRAIFNARRQGLRIIHFSLEYDHIHLLIEVENNLILKKGMQAFGVTLAKALNKMRRLKGTVYKHRYHFRQILSVREFKNVMKYIFMNGLKHKTEKTFLNPFHSMRAEMKSYLFCQTKIEYDLELINLLDRAKLFHQSLEYL